MVSIIQTGGKQHLISKGDKIQIEKLKGEVGSLVKFDQVLFSDGQVGKPFLAGKVVEGKILKQAKGDKVRVFKYKSKSKYRRTQGHRQQFTEVEIV